MKHKAQVARQLDGHVARKRFGQNFLQDGNVIDRIVEHVLAAAPSEAEHLKYVEIGPGMGALTGPLFAGTGQLTVVELDKDLATELPMRLGVYQAIDSGAFSIIQADALQFDFSSVFPAARLRVVGNLPYNISTPIIFHLLKHRAHVYDMHFMLQKEVVERITAVPNTHAYGRLSVMVQYYCQCEYLLAVPPGAFIPAPKVDSAVFRLQPYTQLPVQADNEAKFAQLVAHVFTMRRKTLRSSLKGKLDANDFAAANIDPMLRPENLHVADFVALANQWHSKPKP